MDEESNETLTPALVNPSVRPSGNNHDVIDISSDSSGDVHGNVNVGSASRVNRSGHVRRNVNVVSASCLNRSDDVSRRMRVMTFEKIISKSHAKAGPTLIGGGQTYHCTLLWRKDRLKDCHLGKCWYKFVNDMRLARGDKVVF
ncbi:hypothetical protein SESBI_44358 [Sesbania bispinosa]|nr:hypothetical protein SESBI_44358 [Sesbania bispinosa]